MPPDPIEIRENVSLAPLTTLGVGGPARYFARATSVAEVAVAVQFARNRNLSLFVLGGGSNLVISDRGWDGLVLQVGVDGIQQLETPDCAVFDVGAGVNWDTFVAHAVALRYAGIECLSGIPGSVGGTPVQNVGAYGQEVSDTIFAVLVFDLVEQRICDLKGSDCGFAYRRSIFNSSARGRYIVLRVKYTLPANTPPCLRYADLQRYFAGRESVPTLAEIRAAVLSIRATKGMLISPGDPDSRSAGSFFKNPVLSDPQYQEVSRRASARGLRVPSYPALAEQHKISAAWLVENSGFRKGYVRGNAAISSKHALAIVNRGGATAAEIVALKNEIQEAVKKTWEIQLEPEPVFVGC